MITLKITTTDDEVFESEELFTELPKLKKELELDGIGIDCQALTLKLRYYGSDYVLSEDSSDLIKFTDFVNRTQNDWASVIINNVNAGTTVILFEGQVDYPAGIPIDYENNNMSIPLIGIVASILKSEDRLFFPLGSGQLSSFIKSIAQKIDVLGYEIDVFFGGILYYPSEDVCNLGFGQHFWQDEENGPIYSGAITSYWTTIRGDDMASIDWSIGKSLTDLSLLYGCKIIIMNHKIYIISLNSFVQFNIDTSRLNILSKVFSTELIIEDSDIENIYYQSVSLNNWSPDRLPEEWNKNIKLSWSHFLGVNDVYKFEGFIPTNFSGTLIGRTIVIGSTKLLVIELTPDLRYINAAWVPVTGKGVINANV